MAKYKVQSTKYKAQSTKHQAQSTKYQAPVISDMKKPANLVSVSGFVEVVFALGFLAL